MPSESHAARSRPMRSNRLLWGIAGVLYVAGCGLALGSLVAGTQDRFQAYLDLFLAAGFPALWIGIGLAHRCSRQEAAQLAAGAPPPVLAVPLARSFQGMSRKWGIRLVGGFAALLIVGAIVELMSGCGDFMRDQAPQTAFWIVYLGFMTMRFAAETPTGPGTLEINADGLLLKYRAGSVMPERFVRWDGIASYYWRQRNGRDILFLRLRCGPWGEPCAVPQLTPVELGPLDPEIREQIDAALRPHVIHGASKDTCDAHPHSL